MGWWGSDAEGIGWLGQRFDSAPSRKVVASRGGGTRERNENMADDSTIKRIMALLAKAESTEFEGEAATYLAKAQELMVKHSIEQADLKPEERETVGVHEVQVGSMRPDLTLLHVACMASGVSCIRLGTSGKASLIGMDSDVTFAQSLYASLLLQRERFLGQAVKPSYENGRSFNHSFRLGYAGRVHARLEEAKKRTVDESGPGTELVLASKDQLVQARVKQEHPNTRKLKNTSRSRAGHSAGTAAGNRADVSGGRNNLSRRTVEALA